MGSFNILVAEAFSYPGSTKQTFLPKQIYLVMYTCKHVYTCISMYTCIYIIHVSLHTHLNPSYLSELILQSVRESPSSWFPNSLVVSTTISNPGLNQTTKIAQRLVIISDLGFGYCLIRHTLPLAIVHFHSSTVSNYILNKCYKKKYSGHITEIHSQGEMSIYQSIYQSV